jgi:hypothetical protein
MNLTGCEHAILSVFVGTLKWEWCEVEMDAFYMAELMEREAGFWSCVESDTPPVHMPAVAAPVPQAEWREVDFSTNNLWMSCADDWLTHRDGKRKFDGAERDIKSLMEDDIGMGSGGGIVCKRAKNGSLRISEER